MSEGRPRTAGVVAPPPLILAGFLALGLAADHALGVAFAGGAAVRYPLALVLFAAAAALALAALLRFRARATPVEPWHPTTTLVTDGVFAVSRNPIYVAFLMVQLAVGLAFGGPVTLALTAPLLAALHFGVVLREERYLASLFGEAYASYRRRVRRYL